jgi:hypothetical protein
MAAHQMNTQYDAANWPVRSLALDGGTMTTIYGRRANGIRPPAHAVTTLNGSQKYWYDLNGNMITRNDGTTTWTLDWTAENMLHTATDGSSSVDLVYDADNRLVQRTENGQTTNYLGSLYQHNLTTGAVKKQYQFNGRLIAVRDNSGLHYLIRDHLGSASVTLNTSGAVQARLRYTPWGETRYNHQPLGLQIPA